MIAAWMFFSLFTVGLLGFFLLLWSSAGCRPGNFSAPLVPQTREWTFPVIL